MKKLVIFSLTCLGLLFVLMACPAKATFVLKNSSLTQNYAGEDLITGSLNISFRNEPVQSRITSNIGGNVTLIDFLKANGLQEGLDYQCTFSNCSNGYHANEQIQTLTMQAGERKVIGFVIQNSNIAIDDLALTLESNAPGGCQNQLSLDILGRGEYVYQNSKRGPDFCPGKRQGCFSPGSTMQSMIIGADNAYCQKIVLSPAPAYRVGARVKNSSIASGAKLMMQIIDNESSSSYGECYLPKNTQNIEELGCEINWSNSVTQEYFVCISATSSNSNYEISAETSSPVCGKIGTDAESYTMDFDIFAQQAQFGTVNLSVTSDSFESAFGHYLPLKDYLQSYIQEVYHGNCEMGCILPFSVSSALTQTVTISLANLKYRTNGALTYTQRVSRLTEEQAALTSNNSLLDVGILNISTPLLGGINILSLFLNDQQIIRLPINISAGFYIDVQPKIVPIALEKEFVISSGSPISRSSWKFGNEQVIDVEGNKINHTTYQEGELQLEVTAFNSSGNSVKKTFRIQVGEAKGVALSLLTKDERLVNELNAQVGIYPLWLRNEIEKKVNISNIKRVVEVLRNEYNGITAGNYTEVVAKLVQLNVPSRIYEKQSWANVPLGLTDFDVRYAETLSGISAPDREELKKNLVSWMSEEYESSMNVSLIAALDEKGESSALVTRFTIGLAPKNETNNDLIYLIIDYPRSGLVFAQNYGAVSKSAGNSDGTAIPLQIRGSTTVDFLIPKEIAPGEIKAYAAINISKFISPALPVCTNSTCPILVCLPGNKDPKCQRTAGWAYWVYILLVVLFFVVYILLQEWYKRSYQKHLFPEKEDFFNIATFIHNSRMSSMPDNDIRAKLAESSWNYEQINFAFKKIDGKRTGMFEIPIFAFWEKKAVHAEIARRQSPFENARFIKRV